MDTNTARIAGTSNASALFAAAIGLAMGAFKMPATRTARKVPMMVTASPEEIAAWNAAVEARKPSRPAKRDRRALVKMHGRRQFLRMQKEFRAEYKAANGERADSSLNYAQAESF